jgi:hypothetical protein
VTQVGFDRHGSGLRIRLAMLQGDFPPEIKADRPWAWAIVQPVPGAQDRFIIGGQADSQTAAEAQAHLEMQRQEARLCGLKGTLNG